MAAACGLCFICNCQMTLLYGCSCKELEPAILDGLDESDILVGITCLIKGNASGHAVNLDALKRIADSGGVRGIGCLNGLDGCQVGIIAQCGYGRDDVFLFVLYQIFLKALDEGSSLVIGRFSLVKEGGKHNALGVLACVLDDGGILPGIACRDGCRNAKLPCLLDDKRGSGDGGWGKDDVRVGCLDIGQDCLEVSLVGLELLFAYNLPA